MLVRAIQATFGRRAVALTPEFTEDRSKNTQWTAFMRKSGGAAIGDLPAVMAAIALFAVGPLAAAGASASFPRKWTPGRPCT